MDWSAGRQCGLCEAFPTYDRPLPLLRPFQCAWCPGPREGGVRFAAFWAAAIAACAPRAGLCFGKPPGQARSGTVLSGQRLAGLREPMAAGFQNKRLGVAAIADPVSLVARSMHLFPAAS